MDTEATVSIQQQLLAVQRREVQLKQEELRLLRSNALSFYKPHPKQDKFHRAGDFYSRLAEAGNRSGKSEMGAAEDAAWLLGERPWYPEDDPARTLGIPRGPVKGLVICTSWQKVREVFVDDSPGNEGKLLRFLGGLPGTEGSKIKQVFKKLDTIYLIILTNGSSLTFTTVESFKKNPLTAESSNWDFIHVDEPAPEKLVNAQARGLIDRGGKIWYTLTPLSEPWISDRHNPQMIENKEELAQIIEGKKVFWKCSWSMFDNPYISEENIKLFIDQLSDEEKECRLHGRPMSRIGLVYKEFDKSVHVLTDIPEGWTNFATPPDNYTYFVYIDPHPHTPHAVHLYAVSPTEKIFLFNEIFEQMPPTKLAKLILQKLNGNEPVDVRMDPLGFIPDPETGMSMADRFFDAGLPVAKARKDLENGILMTKEALLRPDYLRICPNCVRTLWEIDRYRWDTDKITGAPKNKPVDKDDHMMENLYRAMSDELYYVDPAKSISVPVEIFDRPRYDLDDVSYAL